MKGNGVSWLKELKAGKLKDYIDEAAQYGHTIMDKVTDLLTDLKSHVPQKFQNIHTKIQDTLNSLQTVKGQINAQFAKVGDELGLKIGKMLDEGVENSVRGSSRKTLAKRQKAIPPASQLHKLSTCSKQELHNYLRNIDPDAASDFLRNDSWPSDIQIPKNSIAIRSDGTIDWDKAKGGGYVHIGNKPDKHKYMPQVGEFIDRYGPPNGRYTSPVINDKPYSYDMRALPYLEDPAMYHKYEVVGDMTDIKKYVNNCSDLSLKKEINDLVDNYYSGDYSKITSFQGKIAAVNGWGSGGGIQYELGLSVEKLEKLGILKEVI